ncbi:hypothetical protein CCACVL1_07318 [Corchorus capsularis]|uniref:Uncharacterized protein n=1 Tax=Corchorus capsularis TaxID=210143 RepID=A0A1R3J7B6_COCAP|nr:hypothetical protein CCACVL1_07318 [Corchorus capsularis]
MALSGNEAKVLEKSHGRTYNQIVSVKNVVKYF